MCSTLHVLQVKRYAVNNFDSAFRSEVTACKKSVPLYSASLKMHCPLYMEAFTADSLVSLVPVTMHCSQTTPSVPAAQPFAKQLLQNGHVKVHCTELAVEFNSLAEQTWPYASLQEQDDILLIVWQGLRVHMQLYWLRQHSAVFGDL